MAMPSSLAMTFASGPDERGGSYYAVGKKTALSFYAALMMKGKYIILPCLGIHKFFNQHFSRFNYFTVKIHVVKEFNCISGL